MKKYSILLIALFLCATMFFHTSALVIEPLVPETVYWEDKIDNSVYESPIYENGKRLICLWREDIDDSIISKKMYSDFNYDVGIYENESRYYNEVVPIITSKLTSTKEINSKEITQLSKEESAIVNLAISNDYDNYISAKRNVSKALYTANNNDFVSNMIEDENDIIYCSKYSPTMFLYASDNEIEKYAKCTSVLKITPHIESPFETFSQPIEKSQVGVDNVTGSASSLYNSGNGYQGTGVKIGILEMAKYQSSGLQLNGIPTSQLSYVENVRADGTIVQEDATKQLHATCVTSIIVGKSYYSGGIEYEGIVPDATVYQTICSTPADYLTGFELLVDKGVSIINCSMGTYLGESGYTNLDAQIDWLIERYKITFVAAAGNVIEAGDASEIATGYNVASPGKAYNAITVGSAHTKTSNSAAATAPYSTRADSLYEEAPSLANKPDVVAPGTNIGVITYNPGFPHMFDKTSAAAPIVTGIAAQLHQAKPFLKNNPTVTKAIIMAGADPTTISTVDNPITDNPYLREKSGAGLVNAINSMELSNNYQYRNFSFDISIDGIQTREFVALFNIPAGKKARIVVTFSKIDSSSIPTSGYEDNVDFSLYNDRTDELLASSNSIYNSVEIIEHASATTQQFYIHVTLTSHIPIPAYYPLNVGVAWAIVD